MLRKGFTVVEILIVIVILSILIGIAMASFKGMQNEARITKTRGDLKVLRLAVESYNKNYGYYPYPGADNCRMVTSTWGSTLTSENAPIIDRILKDSFSSGGNQEYQYMLSADNRADANYYLIFSVGPDGAADITHLKLNNSTGSIECSVDDDIYETNGIGAQF